MIRIHTELRRGRQWCDRHRGQRPAVACILGFTETALIPGISAAGKTPRDRRTTAIADAEFLVNGVRPQPTYPLPPLTVGASPTFISRAVIAALDLIPAVVNAGLPTPPAVPCLEVGGQPARCVSSGQALPIPIVNHLIRQGWAWGAIWMERWAAIADADTNAAPYLVVGECVVGGTTTALAVLAGLGYDAWDRVNSSHPHCNHDQKADLVRQGLQAAHIAPPGSPIAILAAVGDPMQCFLSGLVLRVSQSHGVMLAGGTQMLAVYAIARAIAPELACPWQPDRIVVGTTRWVTDDPSGDTVGLARLIGEVPLLSTQLNFATSQYPALQAYEAGFVKEGVGAGGCAIAATLYQNWDNPQLVTAVDQLVTAYQAQAALP